MSADRVLVGFGLQELLLTQDAECTACGQATQVQVSRPQPINFSPHMGEYLVVEHNVEGVVLDVGRALFDCVFPGVDSTRSRPRNSGCPCGSCGGNVMSSSASRRAAGSLPEVTRVSNTNLITCFGCTRIHGIVTVLQVCGDVEC
jgi:hypothetical protein